MDRLTGFVGDLADARVGGGDSFCDRLSCKYTTFLLVAAAFFVTTRGIVNEAIACRCPPHFKKWQVEYTNYVCWVKNTYYLPFDEEIPAEGEDRKMIGYYQWVNLILVAQAFLFYIPRPIWKLFAQKSGIAVDVVTDAAIVCQTQHEGESFTRTVTYIAGHMGKHLKELRRRQLVETRLKKICLGLYGNYLTIVYLVVKTLYIANVIIQIRTMNHVLGFDYSFYGFEMLKRFFTDEALYTSDVFPTVTFCDFKIKALGNVRPYTVQCALPVNLFNQKLFTLVWFWFSFVAAATVGSWLMWFVRATMIHLQVPYVKRRLRAMEVLGHTPDYVVKSFVHEYLRRDGMLLLTLIAKNSSDYIASQVLGGLWKNFRDHQDSIKRLTSKDARAVESMKEDMD